ncbi:hypothetical protein EST38_g9262 [Candolleomyces aberdarensis]|uniref:Uncharacterized protein n=1 Tax=Candolleomyces aberdarensis TaxID=2316362 RepID=A0A4V1Q2X3_9AGAR|nr:hypothetical protein EST38_g9262 [Candolleomyces aberdarensis]
MIPRSDSSPSSRFSSDDLRHVLASAHAVLDQAPPPSLREILSAYRAKGDGDRDMLLAMLNAKTAEDQVWTAFVSRPQSSDVFCSGYHPSRPYSAV